MSTFCAAIIRVPFLIRDDRPLLLVHGVGDHKPGAIQAIVSNALGNAGFRDITPSEFNWDGLFRQARRLNRSLDYADMNSPPRSSQIGPGEYDPLALDASEALQSRA